MYQIVSINILGSPVFPLKDITQRVYFRFNEMVSLFLYDAIHRMWLHDSSMLLGRSMTRRGWGSTWITITTVLIIGSRMVSLIHQTEYRICCLLVKFLHFIDRGLAAIISCDPCSKLRTRSVLQVDCRGIQKLCLLWYNSPSIKALQLPAP